MRQGRRTASDRCLRGCALALCCAIVAMGGLLARAADADAVSPWATGGATSKAGSTDGKPAGTKVAQVPVTQAQPWPGYVIQGGSIPKDWQPQAVPYQAIGPDGKPFTMYYAPTYTFTYPIGPPVMMQSPVNRPQAYAPAAPANGWNYRASGAPPPTYTLPQPTVARYQPPPYQFPPGSQQLAGKPITPPATPLPPASTLSPPPSQWVSIPPQTQSTPDAAGQMFAAAAPPVIAGAAAAASQSGGSSSTPPAMVAVPQSPPLQPVSTTPQQPSAGRSANTHLWRVVGVHDGDTISCLDENNQQQKVRMAEIDAPELGQDFGKVSRDAMAAMVFGKTVQVTDEGKDRYGRWIGHVEIDGVDVNRQMVATGNAWQYAAYSSDKSLASLQSQAQAQRLGLWAQSNPTPPWEYRKTAAQ